MKHLFLLVILFIFTSCKKDTRKETVNDYQDSISLDSLGIDTIQNIDKDLKLLDKTISIELKQKKLIEKKDEREDFQTLIIDKKYVVNKEDYTINFHYPLLNTSFKPTHSNFNEFINEYYVNVAKTESEILESKQFCDSIAAESFREERYIDYKIYMVNDQLLSVLFYKENFYSGAMHPSFSFDGFNFDLNRGVFMRYEDFFNLGSEDELLRLINKKINSNIKSGESFYDCWELSSDDFFQSKNNFVVNDTYIEFYFDDCVMCPSYTGTYSIEIPLVELLSVLKKYDANPLVF
jgi:hypothetical protein